MKSYHLTLFFVVIFLLTSCKTTFEFQQAEQEMLRLKKEGETAGLAVTVSKNNKIIWSKGFGMGHLEQQTPVYPDKTKFRIGSISKALTSAALGILIQEGKLDVDKPIQEYVPYLPKKKYTITTRQVAGHIAGIRHYRGEEFLSGKKYETVKEGLDIFKNDTLLFEPGTKYSYSSYGYNLLSAVIEGASGAEFLNYMKKNVFKPLGMEHTIADWNDDIILYRSGFYEMDKGAIINAPFVDNSYKWAGGGYLSTSEDIVRFGNAILYGELIPKEIVDQLKASQKTTDGKRTNYGMGWSSGINKYGRAFYGHGGGSVGGSCNLIIFPVEKLVIAALTNDSRSKVGNDLHEVAELFMKE